MKDALLTCLGAVVGTALFHVGLAAKRRRVWACCNCRRLSLPRRELTCRCGITTVIP